MLIRRSYLDIGGNILVNEAQWLGALLLPFSTADAYVAVGRRSPGRNAKVKPRHDLLATRVEHPLKAGHLVVSIA